MRKCTYCGLPTESDNQYLCKECKELDYKIARLDPNDKK